MKKIFTALALLAVPALSQAADLSLFFDRPAGFFEETFVLGNGSQGAIVYGNPTCERISLNDITLWTGGPDTTVTSPGAWKHLPAVREALNRGDYATANVLQKEIQGHYSENYQPLGNVFIEFADTSEVSGYSRRLDLNTARASVAYTKSGQRITTEYLASAPDSVIALRITSVAPVDFTLRFESLLPHTVEASGDRIIADGYAAATSLPVYVQAPDDEKMVYDSAKGTRFRAVVDAVARGGAVEPVDGALRVSGSKDVTVYIAMATSFAGPFVDPASGRDCKTLADRRADRAVARGYDAVAARQAADYSRLFSRVDVDWGTTDPARAALPTDVRLKAYADGASDPDLEELYFQFGRYLLIASSRTMGVPANLQGLWNEQLLPPWSSNYTVNINLQENYWPAEITNLSELHMPLLTFLAALPVSGSRTAREYYGVDRGWALGHNTDIWAMTNPVGMRQGNPCWANWNMGGAWLASHIWQHYLFTGDRDFLAAYYPVLRGAAEFCLGWMVEDTDGKLVTCPSTSPENNFIVPGGGAWASTSTGCFADVAMIRQCLADARAAAEVLGTDAAFIAEIDAAMPRLPEYKIGSRGQLQEWQQDFDEAEPTHRHQSHLYGLFPGNHITPAATPELARAAARTLEIKGDDTTGWSTGWRVNLLARLADASKAYAMYRRLLRYVSPDGYQGLDRRSGGGTYPNLLDAHSPFQIDGNFGGTAGVAEMLLQSTPDTITLLPALPEQWATGSFRGLRARGAYTVDASWTDGIVRSLTITSDRGGSTTLIVNGQEIPLTLSPGEPRTIKF